MYKNLVVACLLSLISLDAAHIASKPVVNMHKEPRELSEVVGQLIWAESVDVVDAGLSRWIKVRAASSQEGWVPLASLVEKEEYPKLGRLAMVSSREAHVYLTRDMKPYPPLMTLPYGSKIELVQTPDVQADRWAQVRLITGEIAYMHRQDLNFNPAPLTTKEMISLAKRFIELPYSWGGNSAFGFDNIGFVEMLYKTMGVQLSRDIDALTLLEVVDPVKLAAGDLLLFSLRDDGAVDHVGIYLGNKEFIHASSKNNPPSVQISSLTTPYWQQNLQKCVQVGSGG